MSNDVTNPIAIIDAAKAVFGWQDEEHDSVRELADEMLKHVQETTGAGGDLRRAFLDVEAIARGGMENRERAGIEHDFVEGSRDAFYDAPGFAESIKEALCQVPSTLLRMRYVEYLLGRLAAESGVDTDDMKEAIWIRLQDNDDAPLDEATLRSFSGLLDQIAAGQAYDPFPNSRKAA